MVKRNVEKGSTILEGLAQRVSDAVQLAGGPQIVSEKLGVGVSTVYNYRSTSAGSDYKVPPITFLDGLARLAGVDRAWLFFGESKVELEPEEGGWRVPIYNLEVSAGGGAFPADQEVVGHMMFPEPQLRKLGQPNELALASVKGSSMVPELYDGDMVMFDIGARELKDGVVILRRDDAVLLKRLHVLGRGRVELLSSSPSYSPIPLASGIDDFEVLGRVVYKLTRV